MPETYDPEAAERVRQFIEEHYDEDVEASCPDCGHPVENCQCPPEFEDEPVDPSEMSDEDLAALYVWLIHDLEDASEGTPEDGPQAPPAWLAKLWADVREAILSRTEVRCEDCDHVYDEDQPYCRCDLAEMEAERGGGRV